MTNKSQTLQIMRMRAKIRVEELRKQHQNAWYGKEPKMIEDVKKGPVNQELLKEIGGKNG